MTAPRSVAPPPPVVPAPPHPGHEASHEASHDAAARPVRGAPPPALHTSGRVARTPPRAAASAATPPWATRAGAVARCCLDPRPLTASTRALLAPDALSRWIGRGAGDTLGELLRAAVGIGEGGIVALYDALADAAAPASRALLGRILGAPLLLVTARVRDGRLVGADARACGDEQEAIGLLAALGAERPGRGALVRGTIVGGAVNGDPVALLPGDDAAILAPAPGALTERDALLVLPLFDLDAVAAEAEQSEAATAPAAPAVVFGGSPDALLGAGSPFLEAFDPRAIGGDLLGVPAPASPDEPPPAPPRERGRDRGRDAAVRSEEATGGEEDAAEDAAEDGAEAGATDAAAARDAAVAAAAAQLARWQKPGTAAPPEPEAPTEEDRDAARATLERLRDRTARAAGGIQRVTATVATDDGVLDTVADIIPWLQSATEHELRALIRDRWSGDEATELARALAEDDPEVEEVVRQARRMESELVVEIDSAAAIAWLVHHRPALADRLGLDG